MNEHKPFRFCTSIQITELTGITVHTLPELLEKLQTVPGACIYHHTHRFLQHHQYLSPEPPNDFAYWVTNALQEDRLGEELSSVDIIRYPSIRDLRQALISILDDHCSTAENIRAAAPEDGLHLMKTRTIVMPTPHTAHTLQEFAACLQKISINSIYYHLFESRLRLQDNGNDFSFWLEHEMGQPDISMALSRMDPYSYTIEEIRTRTVTLINNRCTPSGEPYVLT